ncbi:hypothetical protein [Stenotrophomonas maltophilia]|uniref:hypothetical protein n=1 Tax=Stenotrophomonas maltophilia TaxID=40324 RepID=UPI0015DF5087|nr:hypothetical protein [Stenotrophomonas maltophilia]MBA0362403.1 hypothetical protein [Stenotrophomonas maltophilia]
MISAWEIYWVMQLDTIRFASALASIAGLIGLVVIAIAVADVYDDGKALKRVLLVSPMLLIPIAAATFLPSSKTAAAMIVIPAIANNERFQAEAGDLYKLAKQGLQKLVADEQDKKPAAE